jgi:hypothetical protein
MEVWESWPNIGQARSHWLCDALPILTFALEVVARCFLSTQMSVDAPQRDMEMVHEDSSL